MVATAACPWSFPLLSEDMWECFLSNIKRIENSHVLKGNRAALPQHSFLTTAPLIGCGVNLEAGGPLLKWRLLGMRASKGEVSEIVLSLTNNEAPR